MLTLEKKMQATQQTMSARYMKPNQAFSDQSHDAHPILNQQRMLGNQASLRLRQTSTKNTDASSARSTSIGFSYEFSRLPVYPSTSSSIHPMLRTGAPSDICEQEADQIAVRTKLSTHGASGQLHSSDSPNAESNVEDATLMNALWHQTVPLPQSFEQDGFAGPAPTPRLHVLFQGQGVGQPLPDAARAFGRSQYGHDFISVRVHSDDRAAELAAGLSAQAFTFGDHIFFGRNYLKPYSGEGRNLLAHELGHINHYLMMKIGASNPLQILRSPNPTTWDDVANEFLQGITPPATVQLRAQVIAGLRDEASVSATRPQDYQLLLNRGVRIRTTGSGAATGTARYDPIQRIIEVGTSATVQSIADALYHAQLDTLYDPTPAGPILGLPATQQQSVIAERQELDTIISDLFRDMSPQPAAGTTRRQRASGETTIRINLREQILISLRAFSIAQLHIMRDAGLRFWRRTEGLPPGYNVSPCTQNTSQYCFTLPSNDPQFRRLPRSWRHSGDVEIVFPSGGEASYQSHYRMIVLNRPDDQMHWGHLRHELAHAWDDIRNNAGPASRLDAMNPVQRRALILRLAVDRVRDERLAELHSRRATRREILQELGAIGLPTFRSLEARQRGQLGIPDMYVHYSRGLPRPDLAFDSTARQGHSLRNPQEFYAEGFNVFHGNNLNAQARLLSYALELYNLLEQEAQAAGRIVPSRSALQAYIASNAREFPPRRP